MIIPMLNVDGVIAGNHRTGLSGKDFNRQFVNPDKFILPEISALKDLVVKSKQTYGKNLLFFLDFHGHSIKKNVFIYGP
jgi:predicted deacylase